MRAKKIFEDKNIFKLKKIDEVIINTLFKFKEIYNRADLDDSQKIFEMLKFSSGLPKDTFSHIHLLLTQFLAGGYSSIILTRLIDETNENLRKLGYIK